MSDHVVAGGRSIFGHMLRGSMWALLMRWSTRAIGLVSTMILARLLTPQDFGIVAMGTLVMSFLTMFSELGVDGFVIRSREATREICDTGWTIKILQGLVIGLVLVAAAPLAVRYFDEPRLPPVLYVLALAAVATGFENIGMTLVRKELDFARDFRFMVYKRLVTFVVSVTLAFLLESYWALVFGIALSAVLGVPLSYGMHSYRPRFSFAQARGFLTFGASILLINIARFFNERVDALVVGGVSSTAAMGTYNVASDVSRMATNEIVAPIGRSLYPSYARVAGDPDVLKSAYLRSLSAIALVCLPLGVGLAVVAEDTVQVVLGPKWSGAVPLLQWLAIYALLNSLMQGMMGYVLIVVGRQWLATALRWGRVALLAPAVVVAGTSWGVGAIPVAATGAAAAFVPVVGYVIIRVLPIRGVELGAVFWRPVAAAMLMAGVIWFIHPLAPSLMPRFLGEVLIGAVTYGVCVMLLWMVAGRPVGVEEMTLRAVAARIGRR